MAYDSRRNVIVLFGGESSSGELGDTWEWDDVQWWLRSTTGPEMRSEHAMAYDSLRGVVVLFGGYHASESHSWLRDTWEWDGTTWTLRSTGGPQARYDHAMAFDSNRNVTVLFGGYPFGTDTWEWDGTAWTGRAFGLPPFRGGNVMAFDSARGVTVMFGGYDSQTQLNDTWEWDGEAWSQRSTTGPLPRAAPAMAYDSVRGVTVLHGGYDTSPTYSFSSTWAWDGASWKLMPSEGFGGRSHHAMVFDEALGVGVVFGGSLTVDVQFVPHADTWAWNGDQWTLRDAKPPGRYDAAMAFDAPRGLAVLFGGEGNERYRDTWEWNGAVWVRRATTGPYSRSRHAMAYDSVRRVTLVFGPSGVDEPGDLWQWNGEVWSLLHAPGPDAGNRPAVTFDSVRGVLVFVREQYTDNPLETWEWDGKSWALRSDVDPPRRELPLLAFDSRRGVTVLYGGRAGNTDLVDTWEWNGAFWTLRNADGPIARGKLTFDAERGVSVLCGENSTWEWDGMEWTYRAELPNPVYLQATTYDSIRRETVLFGAWTDWFPYRDQTWLYAARTADVDQDRVADECDACPRTIPNVPVDDDGCPAIVAGDADRDGDVDLNDCATFVRCFGTETAGTCETADMDGDGIVGPLDVAGFLQKLDGPNVPAAP